MLIDVFRQDAFSMLSMTAAVERNPHIPTGIGALNIFDPMPVRTPTVAVEERDGVLSLIPTSPRGGPGAQRTTEQRKMRNFNVPRLRQEDTIYASEIAGIRAFGEETEVMAAQSEVARRLYGSTGLLSNIEYTKEYMRLGAIQGILLDATGSTIYDFFTEFDRAAAAEVDFDLDNASPTPGALRNACTAIVRAMQRASGGAFLPTTRVHALCGDTFYDQLINHVDVRDTYKNWEAAADLRKDGAFRTFTFGGIDWTNYRGSDDGSTIAIATTKAKFFPVGAPGVFQEVMAPHEAFDFVNTPGKPVYVRTIFDRDRDEWVKIEASAYPLFICTRPDVLRSARNT